MIDLGPDEAYDAYKTPPASQPMPRYRDKRPLSQAALRHIRRAEHAAAKELREREKAAERAMKYPPTIRP